LIAESSSSDPARKRLVDGYRSAWAFGSLDDRKAVLEFIVDAVEIDGVDLVVEALRAEEESLATVAVDSLMQLLGKGHSFPRQVRDELVKLVERHPALSDFAEAAVTYFDLKVSSSSS
jgi:hypothetical protein